MYCILPSTRQHLSRDDCLEVRRENNQNCYVLYCARMGPGYPHSPLFLPCPFTSSSFGLFYFFRISFFIRFTYCPRYCYWWSSMVSRCVCVCVLYVCLSCFWALQNRLNRSWCRFVDLDGPKKLLNVYLNLIGLEFWYSVYFYVTWLWTWQKRQLRRVDRQSHTGLIYCNVKIADETADLCRYELQICM